jgi:hypothetical protein
MEQTDFPKLIKLKDLLATHAEYNPQCKLTKIGLLDKHDALYQAGQKFREFVKAFLIRRSIECSNNSPETTSGQNSIPTNYITNECGELTEQQIKEIRNRSTAGEGQYEARLRRAWYTPLVSGMIDFMVAAVNQNQPTLVASDPAKAGKKKSLLEIFISLVRKSSSDQPESKTDYWNNLNKNADGKGMDLAAVMRAALNEGMIHKRAYLAIRFPKVEAENLAVFEAAGGHDAKISLLTARDVDDWEEDEDGRLVWIRTHRSGMKRATTFGAPSIEWHCWTYITKEAILEYEAEWKVNERPTAETFDVKQSGNRPHSLKRLPVVRVRINDGLWVMDRLADTVLALFNRQSAATWTLDQMAFALLVIATNENLTQLNAEDVIALKVAQGDSANFVAPPPAIFDAQQKDIERLNGELSNSLHLMALRAEKDKGGNPASGAAKAIDRGGMIALLSAFASPMRDALEECVEVIQLARKDGVAIAVNGLDNFDTEGTDAKVATATDYLALPGIPDSGRRWALLETSLAMASNAPPELRETIVQEVMTDEAPEKPEIKEPILAGAGAE